MTVEQIKKEWIISPIDNHSISINGYKGNETEIEIPCTVGNKVVTRIGERAFRPESHKMQRTVYRALKRVHIPDTVEYIGSEAFQNCVSLETVNLPPSIYYVSNGAFENCKSLKEIVIPESLTSLSSSMFRECSSLTRCTFSSPDICLSSGTFYGCKSLRSLEVLSETERMPYKLFQRTPYDYPRYALAGCISLETILFHEGTEEIWEGICYGCTKLKQIIIPEGVLTIGANAFRDCKAVSKITIPQSVQTIGCWAFWGMDNLQSVVIKNPDVQIEMDAFAKCPKLERVT